MGRLVYGVGINDADYVVRVRKTVSNVGEKQKQELIWSCPFYDVWVGMLKRAYSDKYKLRYPTYKDVTVCEQWYLFSNFRQWMAAQDYEGKHLDKDILFLGNKEYSADTCVFVSVGVNLFVGCGSSRGKYKIGVCWHKDAGKYLAACHNPFTRKNESLGLFTTEKEAHEAWLSKKLEHAHALAELQTDERVAKALIDRYEKFEGY